MLTKVIIRDFILIDTLEIDFDSGLNILTGETGAGKSIILGAIRLALGDRVIGKVVREGANKATIQAVFAIDHYSDGIAEHLEENDNTLILTREIYNNGKSLIKINETATTLNHVKQITKHLLSIHGQNDFQSLLHQTGQLKLIDMLLLKEGRFILNQVNAQYQAIIDIENKIAQLLIAPEGISKEIEFIEFQMSDIDNAALTTDDETIENQYKTMSHAQSLLKELDLATYIIESDNYETTSINKLLMRLVTTIQTISEYMPEYREKLIFLNDVVYELTDLAKALYTSAEQLTFSQESLLQVEKRLDTVNHLKKKYGNTIDDIMAYRAQLETRRKTLIKNLNSKDDLEKILQTHKQKYFQFAKALSETRKKQAKIFIDNFKKTLIALNFNHVEAEFNFNESDNISSCGIDTVELMVSLNKGQPLAPLRQVASGGEISRIMLAIKSIISASDEVDVLIFDEIDSGISGVTASVVADKLYQISKYRQAICITHLSQMALMADRHFLIVKDNHKSQTISRVVALTESQRIKELMRIIGGHEQNDDLYKQVEKLYESANNRKRRI